MKVGHALIATYLAATVLVAVPHHSQAARHTSGSVQLRLNNGNVAYQEQLASENKADLNLGLSQHFDIIFNESCCELAAAATAMAWSGYGVNRALASGLATVGIPDTTAASPFFVATGSATATSEWSDTWFLEGPAGEKGRIVISGTVEGSLTIPALLGPTPESIGLLLNAGYAFSASAGQSFNGNGVSFAESAVATGTKQIHESWSFFVDVPFNSAFVVTSNLGVTVAQGGASGFYGTARFGTIEIPEGSRLSSESGELAIVEGKYVYVGTVPEPHTVYLVLLGTATLFFAGRRSRGRDRSAQLLH